MASAMSMATATGTALHAFSLGTAPAWSQQANGTICAPMLLAHFLRLRALFAEVAALFEAIGVAWLLSHGSLLGSWLHHGPIPWDEEGDVLLLPADFARLHEVLGPPPGAPLRHVRDMTMYEGPNIGALQYDYHEHVDSRGGWLASCVTFRLVGDPRDSPVHLDAFLARTNGTHAWTDSAVLPLAALLPPRYLRFYDWLAPAPNDPEASLALWYGPRFAARRKCALRAFSASAGSDGQATAHVTQAITSIAEVPGGGIARAYPLVKNEWLADGMLRCTLHRNATGLWVLEIDTEAGRLRSAVGLPRRPRLSRLAPLPALDAAALPAESSAAVGLQADLKKRWTLVVEGPFPRDVPNMWD
eukprot:TRINITY_DN32466_c0_g1_i1.p1 TRINITY_DN32466_c0_g1~~TRINITY_DN32466_c0_g1_i1.p1  ORF type:complete len:359 (-),score=70.30 TRINITY_DN32466_c0_g1_i1:221-1297(-)